MENVIDRLEVKVIEGRDIKSSNNQLKPNSYAVVECGYSSQQTLHILENSNPIWNSSVMIFTGLVSSDINYITLTVYNKDIIGNQDTIIGKVVISLDTVYNAPQIAIDDWYDLLENSTQTEIRTNNSSVRVILTYWNTYDPDLVTNTAAETDELEQPPNLLEVRLVSGDNFGVVKGALEAFVVVQVGDQRQISKVCTLYSILLYIIII
jgi:hypothetical protein